MTNLLFNPFKDFSDKTLLIFGILATTIGVYVGWLFNAQFDGIIDLHFGNSISAKESMLLTTIDIIVLTVLLSILGRIINPKTRIIDVIMIILIARIPIYFLSLMNINNKMFKIGEIIKAKIVKGEINNISFLLQSKLLIMSVLSFLVIIWFSVLLFNGFKVSTNLKEKKHIVFFAITLLLAEIISKIVISYSI